MARRYEFRPAKAAQRRMIVTACGRLTAVAALKDYQYVGFGGLEFIDFVEFHRGLGVEVMTSIEKDTSIQHRLDFNKPYKSIRVLMGEARNELPNVDWTRLAITWLDYTDVLSRDMLRDVDYVVRASQPGSVILVTVNAGANSPLDKRLSVLRDRLGDLVPDHLTDEDMVKFGAAQVQRQILQATAHAAGREAHAKPVRQLFNFHYADDAKMLTWGGVVTSTSLDRTIDLCRFDDLAYVRSGSDAFEIRVPVLTAREVAYLEHEFAGRPPGRANLPRIKGVDVADIERFEEIYRWHVAMR